MEERNELQELMTLQTGDEKHESSATSTLDVLQVLYDRILRYRPDEPEWEGRDRFLLSKGHGPMAFYAVLAAKGFFTRQALTRFLQRDGILAPIPTTTTCQGSRCRPARSATDCRWQSALRTRCARRDSTSSGSSCSPATPS